MKHSSAVFAFLLLIGCSTKQPIPSALPPVAAVGSTAFKQNVGASLGSGFLTGNRVDTLENGKQIFPALLAAIHSARSSINFETFVFYNDSAGRLLTDALVERARAGVPVRVIIDGVGGNHSSSYRREMEAAGALVEVYHPLLGLDPFRANHRTHRKLLIVDGKVGFIGGVGIGKEWLGNATNPEEWHDLHYRLQGPVVVQLQAAFQENWLKLHHEIYQGPAYYPDLVPVGPVVASAFGSSPLRSRFGGELMYHLAIASARKSITIENPYFLPDPVMIAALGNAAQRGVYVRILLPGKYIDQKAVRRASRKRWKKLLAAGVHLFEYQPTMNHTKLLVVDHEFVSIGSCNLDPRSLRINDEANVNLLDKTFAATQERIFALDLQKSLPVRLDSAGNLMELPTAAATTPVESQL